MWLVHQEESRQTGHVSLDGLKWGRELTDLLTAEQMLVGNVKLLSHEREGRSHADWKNEGSFHLEAGGPDGKRVNWQSWRMRTGRAAEALFLRS